jgi:two-component system, sensor histidine kinase
VLGDPTRLEQIFSNLLNNAAKYTDPGGRIDARLSREGKDVVLRVRDTGIGIAPEMIDRVFELFAQVDQSPARTGGGLGVGLTLVKQLVEAHGGTVQARSKGLGQGSEFEVRLPLLDEETERPAARPVRPGIAARRILLVEDNPDIGETLRDLLELLGHSVELAGDGLRGVEKALSSQPEVALVDIGLPGIDGYEVARRLRQTAPGREMLLIALTGYGRPEDRDRARAAGFDAHLVKPVDPEELLLLFSQLREQRETRAAGQA